MLGWMGGRDVSKHLWKPVRAQVLEGTSFTPPPPPNNRRAVSFLSIFKEIKFQSLHPPSQRIFPTCLHQKSLKDKRQNHLCLMCPLLKTDLHQSHSPAQAVWGGNYGCQAYEAGGTTDWGIWGGGKKRIEHALIASNNGQSTLHLQSVWHRIY